MAPQFQDQIFGAFRTLKSKDELEAPGMGLVIVKKAAEALAGTITIESDGARGSLFRVFFPADTAAARAAQLGGPGPRQA